MAVEERIQQSLERAAEPSGTPDVRLDRVTKKFDDVVAVDDLSLEIPRGSFFALLGPSAQQGVEATSVAETWLRHRDCSTHGSDNENNERERGCGSRTLMKTVSSPVEMYANGRGVYEACNEVGSPSTYFFA